MNILVLGSGGREHALAWKIAQSKDCESVYLHPGNAGSRAQGFEPLSSSSLNLAQLIKKASEKEINLVVIGPEMLLADGYADGFRKAGFLVVGPSKEAANLETSKIFAKEFMVRAKIPTAPYEIANSYEELVALSKSRTTWPTVLKLDGLAAGKGVVIAKEPKDVVDFADRIWKQNGFGEGNHRVLVEAFLPGREVSYIGLCDGKTFLPLPTATDYKRIGEGNTGPNTGGMGCISPSPFLTSQVEGKITKEVIGKLLAQLEKEKIDYRGALFIGLMIDDNGEPSVLEFNARFGDPETQAILLRLKTDFLMLLEATASGSLSQCPRPQSTRQTSIYVVGAAEGYPGSVKKGDSIENLEKVSPTVQVFFAGVSGDDEKLSTSGGRVLGLGCLEDNLEKARETVYENLSLVNWDGMQYRKDIGM